MMPTTEEYAELCLRLGVMATKLDQFFGTDSLKAMLRKNASPFTPDMLTTLEDGAIKLGVPEDVIQEARQMSDQLMADPEIRSLIENKRQRGHRTVQ